MGRQWINIHANGVSAIDPHGRKHVLPSAYWSYRIDFDNNLTTYCFAKPYNREIPASTIHVQLLV